ncbi:hypothetical protein E3N88_34866 [Mikania micrantha]|uniref:Mechanosensitive channel protein 2/3 transmembrane domain-containing protein n=1 Tax=Mikania micrantha TaxID=192012 RepID=A0A5N6M082_9ASTR|nr:hypothetical protein E3N88_34866 [Mikania micrantha]
MSENSVTIPDELTMQIVALLWNGLGAQPTTTNSENLSIGIKINGDNYALWSTLMKKAIGVNNVSQYPTSKTLWDGLAITYGSETNSLQIFDLHKKANSLKQGADTIEECWNKLQNIWMTIYRRDPNPMKDLEGIKIYNKKLHEQRLYQLLTAIDDKLEPIKRDILKRDPLPSIETAYATIRREIARLNILKPDISEISMSSEIGLGLVAKESIGRTKTPQNKEREDKPKLYCSHCKMKRNTKETCGKLFGYPKWWEDNHKEKSESRGKGATAIRNQSVDVEPVASEHQGETIGFGGMTVGMNVTDGSNIIMNVNTCKSITLPAFLTVTDLCRVLEPVILPSASNQAVKQRLLNFFCSLSTVLAFAYCLSRQFFTIGSGDGVVYSTYDVVICFGSLIQQTQKYFADKKDPSDARTIHDLEVQMEVERRSRQELEPRRIRKERR